MLLLLSLKKDGKVVDKIGSEFREKLRFFQEMPPELIEDIKKVNPEKYKLEVEGTQSSRIKQAITQSPTRHTLLCNTCGQNLIFWWSPNNPHAPNKPYDPCFSSLPTEFDIMMEPNEGHFTKIAVISRAMAVVNELTEIQNAAPEKFTLEDEVRTDSSVIRGR